jgi:hypothetical protein
MYCLLCAHSFQTVLLRGEELNPGVLRPAVPHDGLTAAIVSEEEEKKEE